MYDYEILELMISDLQKDPNQELCLKYHLQIFMIMA